MVNVSLDLVTSNSIKSIMPVRFEMYDSQDINFLTLGNNIQSAITRLEESKVDKLIGEIKKYTKENIDRYPSLEPALCNSAIYVRKVSPGDQTDKSKKLTDDLGMSITTVDSIKALLPIISNPHFACDFIAISLEDLYNISDTSVFDVINTINTVIKCTRPPNYQIPVVVLVSEDSETHLIREVIKIPSVVLGLKCGGTFTYEIVRDEVIEYTRGNFTNSKKVLDLLKPKKTLNPKKEFALTHRQEQILKLICERGLSNKLIAATLKVSESTVKLHIGAILKKFGVKNRTQLAVFSRKELS